MTTLSIQHYSPVGFEAKYISSNEIQPDPRSSLRSLFVIESSSARTFEHASNT